MSLDKGVSSPFFKSSVLSWLKTIYHKLYMGLAKLCGKRQLYKKSGLVRVHDVMHSTIKGIKFAIKGYSTNNRKQLPDYYINDAFQNTLLAKFEDELDDISWTYPYGIIEMENACFAFPYVIHRSGNTIVRQGVGDSEYCLCQPRYLLSYLSTFLPNIQKLDAVILLPLPFFENYYHWIIETLPRLKMISEDARFDQFPIVIPKRRCPGFVVESIALMGFADRVVFLESGAYRAKHLFIPTLYAPRGELSLEAVKWLNDKILGADLADDDVRAKCSVYERIFISRDDAETRRVINTAEVDMLLNKYGITKVSMSKYSVIEQAKIFKGAKLIIGLHGAALSNVVYCSKETTLLEIFMDGWFTKAFYNLTRVRGMKYGFLLCRQEKGDIYVDTNKLENVINMLIPTHQI